MPPRRHVPPPLASLCIVALRPRLFHFLADANAVFLLSLLPPNHRAALFRVFCDSCVVGHSADASAGLAETAVRFLCDGLPALCFAGPARRVNDDALLSLDLRCTRELDVRCCDALSADALARTLSCSPWLTTLRVGGTRTCDAVARALLPALLPRLELEQPEAADTWEHSCATSRSCAASALCLLHWEGADARSRALVARRCPRISVFPPASAPWPDVARLRTDGAARLRADDASAFHEKPGTYLPPHVRASPGRCECRGLGACCERKRVRNARQAARRASAVAGGGGGGGGATAAVAAAADRMADEPLLLPGPQSRRR